MKSRRAFKAGIAMLIIGMGVGFILLSMVFPGPRWAVFLLFLAYVFVACMVIRFSVLFVKEYDKKNK